MRRRGVPMDARRRLSTPAFVRPDEWRINGSARTTPAVAEAPSSMSASSGILWREIIGNGFGLASALLGMRRKVAAWPIGIVGNVLLFTVFVGSAMGGAFTTHSSWICGARPAARCSSSRSAFTAGCRWYQYRKAHAAKASACGRSGPGPRGGSNCWSEARLDDSLLFRPEGARLLGPAGRRLDPGRLDPGHVRDGSRLGGVLAGLDRGRRGRGPAAVESAVLPDGDHVHDLRIFCVVGFVVLAADRTPGARRSTSAEAWPTR